MDATSTSLAKSNTKNVFLNTIELAISKFNGTFDEMLILRQATIKFTQKGKCAGTAHKQTSIYGDVKYFININPEMLEKCTEDEVKKVVIHEVAHLVCFAHPRLGNGHNRGWQRVCIMLGGDGKRTHSLPLSYARKVTVKRHVYIIQGKPHQFTTPAHNKLQKGRCSFRGTIIYPSDYKETLKISVA